MRSASATLADPLPVPCGDDWLRPERYIPENDYWRWDDIFGFVTPSGLIAQTKCFGDTTEIQEFVWHEFGGEDCRGAV